MVNMPLKSINYIDIFTPKRICISAPKYACLVTEELIASKDYIQIENERALRISHNINIFA